MNESFDGVGHEAFAAGFVDGRGETVGDFHGEALLGSGYGGGEAGRACSNDEDIWGGGGLGMNRVRDLIGVHGRAFEKRLC